MNLNQITVPSLDVEKSIAFYETLGLHLIVRSLPKYARFECPDGDSTFSIHLVEKCAEGEGITVYFEVNDVAAKVLQLEAKGITFYEQAELRTWGWTEARLLDPDNNKVIIFHGGTHRKNPPWRIN